MRNDKIRRHHLIEEAKAELDVAYEEVKRAEQTIMDLEHEYNERINEIRHVNGARYGKQLTGLMVEKEERQKRLKIAGLYAIQSCAVERFAMVSSAFTIVSSVSDQGMCLDLIRKVLFREDEMRRHKVEIDRGLRNFARGLRAYSWKESNQENDLLVRGSWAEIEGLLRGLGRNI